MKLLIKIFLEDINLYDFEQIINALDGSITDKENTNIYIMYNNSKFKFRFESFYMKEIHIPKLINHNLNNLNWDIVLPIINPLIITKGFDTTIKNIYKQKFDNFDGVLVLNNEHCDKLPIIGKNYYKEFNYIYNPVYVKKNYLNEFYDILLFKDKYQNTSDIKFKFIELKHDDDNIYELRKKTNFSLLKK